MSVSENTRISKEVLDEARAYCISTERILIRFLDSAIKNELKRRNNEPDYRTEVEPEPEEKVIVKGSGW